MGSRRKQCILVGNAVPPLLAAKIANKIKMHFHNNEKISENFIVKKNEKLNVINIKDIKSKKLNFNFIDLFSGAGGISIGLKEAGFNCLLSNDFDKNVKLTYEKNFPNTPFVYGDIKDKKIKKQILEKIKGQKVDLIVGGPPCQGFSIFGKRRFKNTKNYNPLQDDRNDLIKEYFDYIKIIRPSWIIMENVEGIISLGNGIYIDFLKKTLKNLGYLNFDYRIINSADYGVPQKRKRFILIANNTEHLIPWPKPKYFKEPKDWQLPYRTVGEVISDLATNKSQILFKNHKPMKHSTEIIQRYSYVEEGKKMEVEKLPKKLQYGKFTGKKIKNFSHVYRRLHRNEASITLVPGHNAFPIHPWLNRLITVREAARLQTFPDEIEFCGSSKGQCIQVGNAFPCLVAQKIGEIIYKTVSNNWSSSNTSKLAKYSLLDKWYYNSKKIS
jgi:DNA (cytosine-5)-methyltransferase 1